LHFHEIFKKYKKIKTPIKGRNYNLVIADTPKKKSVGLSMVSKLPKGSGMIFIYNYPVKHAFTMENTSIPLTIIFLDSSFKILEVFKCGPFHKKKIQPSEKYSYVIEI